MRARLVAGFVLAGASALVPVLGEGVAAADTAVPAPSMRGAIVVAVSDDAGPPAQALAREVYRDAMLRPSIDDATARVLAAEPPPAASDAPQKQRLADIAETRASIAAAGDGAAARRLLASLGAEASAALVVAVNMEGGRPVARALRVASASYERVELGATVATAESGERSYQWPGATDALRGLLPPEAPKPTAPATTAPAASAKAPAASAKAPAASAQKSAASPAALAAAPKPQKPTWASPWFWGAIGVVAAAGGTVLVLALTSGKPSTVHLDGRVTP